MKDWKKLRIWKKIDDIVEKGYWVIGLL